ncbi:MAG: hypothetical protein GX557_00700, partial [Chloroflexi bacterium]|nr:hypothetical protein [Chloroflexota bacterium]
MTGLLYREDYDEVRDRLTLWWNGGDIGRPTLLLTAPRERPLEEIPALPKPPGWVTDYSISNYAYRLNLTQRACTRTHYLAEALPHVAPDLAPGCVSLYLGCRGVETDGTVWMEPCITEPERARFELDPDNVYWQFTLRLARDQARLGQGKFMLQFPDLIEGLDTLAAMRGTEALLVDLVDRPAWVREALTRISRLYFGYYDPLYELIKDERGGSIFWCWAPGRMAKLQCDYSAMISAAMFREFMVPVLLDLTRRLDYSMYHWDGPGAIQHHDALLAIPRLSMLQWTPGDGQEPIAHPRWWPLFHKTVEAG